MIHEAGHGVWNRLLSHNLRARFIKHYADSVRITPTELEDIQSTAAEFDVFPGKINQFQKSLPNNHRKMVFKKMIRWIKEVHKIAPDDIEKLRFGGIKIASYFPNHKIITSQLEPVITQYGTKNAVEFFCDGFAHYFLNKKMPKDVRETFVEVEKEICK
jgi:hypothetical protein